MTGDWLATSFLSQFGYLPLKQWTHRESNSDLRHARAVSSRWTMSPSTSVDRRGIEPRFPACKAGVVPLDQQPVSFKSRTRCPGFMFTADDLPATRGLSGN